MAQSQSRPTRTKTWNVLSDRPFRRFWTAGAVSALGSGVGGVALPLTAVSLGASAMDMGILAAASQLPVLFLALHAGVWVDRLPRRPIMMATNIGRGAALMFVPAASMAGILGIELLWLSALGVGILAVIYDLAVTSYPPTLIPRERLADANAVLTAGGQGAQMIGRGAAGWLVAALSAPVAIAVDALSFIAAAAVLATVQSPETHEVPPRRGIRAEIAEGFAVVWRDPILLAMVSATTIGSFGGAITGAVFVLFAVRDVGLTAPALGGVLACGTAVSLVASLIVGGVSRRLQPGGALVVGQAVGVAGALVMVAAPSGAAGFAVLALAQALTTGGLAIFSVTQISLRQAITPPHLLGRVNAVRRVTVFGVIPVGALAGGYFGDTVSLRTALAVAATVAVAALVVTVVTPLSRATTETG